MLPFVLLLSLLACLDRSYASLSLPRWRPDLRIKGLHLAGRSGLLEGLTTDTAPVTNSTIISVTLSTDQQTYYALLTFGQATLRVALDTGSADLWVVSTDCKSGTCDIPKYPLTYESSTFVSVNSNQTSFDVSYADGTGAQGFIALESMSFGNMTVPDQAFGLATSSNVTFTDEVSGVLGLGFPRLSSIFDTLPNGTATPLFATMSQSGMLDYPLFGLSLTRDASGTLTFGAIDGSVVLDRTQIEFNEVVPFAPFGAESTSASYLQWAVVLESISVNGTVLTPEPTYPKQTMNASLALIDVGTPGIYGPYQDVARIFAMIDSARLVDDTTGQYVVPCDTEETMAFNFGGQDFILQPTDYLIGPASGNPNLCLSWPRALPPSSDGIDWQIGTPFLRTVYSVYSFGINDKEPPMIGLYPLSNSTVIDEPYESVSAFLASISATVATTLPNYLISTPTYTTPAYTFNTSVSATPGKIVKSGLATSTYSALLGAKTPNASAIATLTPSPTVATLVVTDTAGHTHTTTSVASVSSITLGVPEGWSNAGTRALDSRAAVLAALLGALLCALV